MQNKSNQGKCFKGKFRLPCKYIFFIYVFLPSFLGTVNGTMVTGETEIPVFQAYKLEMDAYTPYFTMNDEVSVKFAHMDSVTYEYWKINEELQVLNPMYSNLPSNIRGGIGYWAGYGATFYHLKLTEEGVQVLNH